MIDPTKCPLCGEPNNCQLCTNQLYKGPCWCESVTIPKELLAKVPTESKNAACICRNCVQAALQKYKPQANATSISAQAS